MLNILFKYKNALPPESALGYAKNLKIPLKQSYPVDLAGFMMMKMMVFAGIYALLHNECDFSTWNLLWQGRCLKLDEFVYNTPKIISTGLFGRRELTILGFISWPGKRCR